MKNVLTILILLFANISFAQVRPDLMPEKEPALDDAVYSQEDGSLKKVKFSKLKPFVSPDIVTAYVPPALYDPNSNYKGKLMIVNQDVYYVDGTGKSYQIEQGGIIGTDDQAISLTGNTLTLEDGGTVNLSILGYGFIASVGNHGNYIIGATEASPHYIGQNSYLSSIFGTYDDTIRSNSIASNIIGSPHSVVDGSHNLSIGGSYHKSGNGNDYNLTAGGTGLKATGGYSTNIGGTTTKASGLRSGIFGATLSETRATQSGILLSRETIIDSLSNGSIAVGGKNISISDQGNYKSEYTTALNCVNCLIENGDYSLGVGFNINIGNRFTKAIGRDVGAFGEYAVVIGRQGNANAFGSFLLKDGTNNLVENNTINSLLLSFQSGVFVDSDINSPIYKFTSTQPVISDPIGYDYELFVDDNDRLRFTDNGTNVYDVAMTNDQLMYFGSDQAAWDVGNSRVIKLSSNTTFTSDQAPVGAVRYIKNTSAYSITFENTSILLDGQLVTLTLGPKESVTLVKETIGGSWLKI